MTIEFRPLAVCPREPCVGYVLIRKTNADPVVASWHETYDPRTKLTSHCWRVECGLSKTIIDEDDLIAWIDYREEALDLPARDDAELVAGLGDNLWSCLGHEPIKVISESRLG